MKLAAILVIFGLPLAGADDLRLALMLKAQTDFDRVQLAGVPQLTEAGSCVQSQAAALAAAPPSEAALLHYRKGFCLLAEAAATKRPEQYTEAADEFSRAVDAWPAHITPGAAKNAPPEPVSPGLRSLADIARLEATPDADGVERARSDLAAAVQSPVCPAAVMTANFCQEAVRKGREWLGWLIYEHSDPITGAGDWNEAARDFTGTDDGWADWVAGRAAFVWRDYASAVQHYRAAVARWEAERRQPPRTILQSVTPQVDFVSALADLGGSQLLAGDAAGAITTLDRAVREDAMRARPLYLRARAKETSGDTAGALADYNLASRAAFAAAKDLASGEAHFYRGILLYRRKDAARAEDEFASALNFEIPAGLRADAQAWRHLAAVASGSCEASRGYLERSLEAASPYFPKSEARTLASTCAATSTQRR